MMSRDFFSEGGKSLEETVRWRNKVKARKRALIPILEIVGVTIFVIVYILLKYQAS